MLKAKKGDRTPIAPLLEKLAKHRKAWPLCARLAIGLEGGILFSNTLRRLLLQYRRVTLGDYSYGPLQLISNLPPNTRIGRYCSLAAGTQILRRNHPVDWISQHPFFFNASLGIVERDMIVSIAENPLEIGSDVWIGQCAIITSGCKKIGDSSIVASASVVTRDVEKFSIVGGVPARTIRKRVSDEVARILEDSRWWDLSIGELQDMLGYFQDQIHEARAEEFAKRLDLLRRQNSANE